jgi:hypothetical protein
MKRTIVFARVCPVHFGLQFSTRDHQPSGHVHFPIDIIRVSELRGKVRACPGRSPARTDGSRNTLPILRGAAARPRGSVPSQIFPSPASKETRWRSLIRARPNQRNSKASAARSFAVQDLATADLAGVMRINEPNGVNATEFSSIWICMCEFPCWV